MAELPSPHSITIGTLISLYSDVNSPLIAYDSLIAGDNQQMMPSAAQWQLELSRLIQQLVIMREEDGLFTFPPNDNTDNPAGDDEDPNDVIDFDRHSFHDLDGMTDDFLNDFLGHPSLDFSKLQCSNGKKNGKRINSSSPFHVVSQREQYTQKKNSKAASNSFRNQTSLSSLLDRIDDAFYNASSGSGNNRYRRKANRSPPSIALINRLRTASSSIDDLMNLLDEWHALLDGSHIGYPMPGVKTSSSAAVAKTVGVDGESIFGIHLRKLCLGMEEIPFEAMSRLWMAFKSEVDDEAKVSFGLAHAVGTNSRGGNNTAYQNDQSLLTPTATTNSNKYDWIPSSPQIERLLRRTCLHPNLETYLRQEQSAITSIMEELQQTHPECPSISFFRFLSALAKGERTQALESLHRYFDYAMIHERKERAERAVMLQLSGGTSNGTGGNNNAVEGASMRTSGMGGITTMTGMGGITGGMTGGVMNGMIANNAHGGGRGGGNNTQSEAKIYKESNIMEYAAVLLAQMHYRFGFSRLSLQATEEAVRVAQQGGDDECVSFANGWLALTSSSIGVGGRVKRSMHATVGGLTSVVAVGGRLGSRGYRPLVPTSASNFLGRGTLEEEAMLQHCQSRSTQRGLTSLSIGTSLELARRTMYRRDAAGQLCSNESELGPSAPLALDRIQRASAGSSSLFASNRPSAETRMLPNQTTGDALTLGQVHTDVGNMTASDVISTLGRQAMAESGLWDSTGHSSFAALSSCRAMHGWSNDALRRVLSSCFHGPNKGDSLYVDMLERFASMSERAATPTAEWIFTTSAYVHEWSVRLYDVSVSRNFQNLIANHVAFPFNSLAPVETALILLAKSTHLFMQQEDHERARATARQACWLSSRHALFFHQGLYLLQLALIDLEASSSSCSNFESSLSPLLECLHLSEQYVIDPLRAMALSSLSRVFLCMGQVCKARALLNAAIPLLMQHGHVWFQAEACLTLAKCNIAELSSKETDSSTIQLQQNALVQLESAAALFEKIDDIYRLKQVYYLQSRIYQSLPSGQEKRDEAASNFFRLNKMKQQKQAGSKQWESMHGILITDVIKMLNLKS